MTTALKPKRLAAGRRNSPEVEAVWAEVEASAVHPAAI